MCIRDSYLIENTKEITKKMESRGGGINSIELIDKSNELDGYYQIFATFNTVDAMGANFINSCLEEFAETFYKSVLKFNHRELKQKDIEIIMSILSNFVPKCLVTSSVSCRVSELNKLEPETKNFAEKIVRAIEIANIDIHRAVTHLSLIHI